MLFRSSHTLGIDSPDLTVEHVRFFGRLADLEAAMSEWHQRRQDIKHVDEERLWKKLRLEWNYNSNHIEGNTLTYHETELLLIYDRTAGGHPEHIVGHGFELSDKLKIDRRSQESKQER